LSLRPRQKSGTRPKFTIVFPSKINEVKVPVALSNVISKSSPADFRFRIGGTQFCRGVAGPYEKELRLGKGKLFEAHNVTNIHQRSR
jgi:hypothetical protein